MKILHTSDWHLGQRFINQERSEEHRLALEWLLRTIREREIEVLLVAGDVFDTGTPSNTALRQYYEFLTRLVYDCPHCRQVIIVGGNHDSPATLNAPKALLENLNVRVVGCAQRDVEGNLEAAEEIVELRSAHGEVCGAVAAVPFLRDRDLKYAHAGETATEREAALREGIRGHYLALRDVLQPYHAQGLPLIACGHLYAAGASLGDSEQEIHIGNLGRIAASHFPPEFAYVALGHLHKAQRVGGTEHIRYCGSLLPLSFAEAATPKVVLVAEFDGPHLARVVPVEIPVSRKLVRFQGKPAAVLEQIHAYDCTTEALSPWAEVVLDLDGPEPHADAELRAAAAKRSLQLLKIVLNHSAGDTEQEPDILDLNEFQPLDVFRRLCRDKNLADEQVVQLEADFRLLQAFVEEETSL